IRHKVGEEAHGTHVAGIAAGNGRSGDDDFPAGDFIGAATGATLILVQPAANDQTTTFTDSARVAEALRYVYDRADQLGLPCVINMSLGQNGGSHDGHSIVERANDRMLEDPGHIFVCAGGTEHTWRTHASGRILTNQGRTLHWRVGACAIESLLPSGFPAGFGDRTPNEMEIWYSSRDRFRVRVADPNGNQTDWFEPGEADSTPAVYKPERRIAVTDEVVPEETQREINKFAFAGRATPNNLVLPAVAEERKPNDVLVSAALGVAYDDLDG
ncbi:MAG: S8 family serine peptidase, partial [Planctomycetales bacterium]